MTARILCPDCGARLSPEWGCAYCALVNWCRACGLPEPVPEHYFDETRRRLDAAWPRAGVAVEIQGGVWAGGGDGKPGAHGRGSGILRDYEKANDAAALGWWVLHYTPEQVVRGAKDDTLDALRTILESAE